MAFHKVLHTVPDLGNRKSGKELVEKFEDAVRIHEICKGQGQAMTSETAKRLAVVKRLRSELIDVCDYSIDME